MCFSEQNPFPEIINLHTHQKINVMAFLELIADHNSEIQTTANRLRDLVLNTKTEVKEQFFGDDPNKAFYSIGPTEIYSQPYNRRMIAVNSTCIISIR